MTPGRLNVLVERSGCVLSPCSARRRPVTVGRWPVVIRYTASRAGSALGGVIATHRRVRIQSGNSRQTASNPRERICRRVAADPLPERKRAPDPGITNCLPCRRSWVRIPSAAWRNACKLWAFRLRQPDSASVSAVKEIAKRFLCRQLVCSKKALVCRVIPLV
jgi:hypothetical protein